MTEGAPKPASRAASPHVFTVSTYFAEGLPYAVVNSLAEILFRQLGASLYVVGLTALFHLPWNLKFLWGPFLDAYETKRWFILVTELAIALTLVGLVAASAVGAGFVVLGALFLALAILSATQDIAVDGFYLEVLDSDEQARFVGYRAPAYRGAMLLVSGPIVMLSGELSFTMGLAVVALMMSGVLLLHLRVLPRSEVRARPYAKLLQHPALRVAAGLTLLALVIVSFFPTEISEAWSRSAAWLPHVSTAAVAFLSIGLLGSLFFLSDVRAWLERSPSLYAQAFGDFLAQDRVGFILGFVLAFRIGESFLMKMKYPFFESLGMSVSDYGFANGTVGMVAALVGPALGGIAISRGGLARFIWPFVLSQNLLNLLYAWLAYQGAVTTVPTWLMTVVITIESFGAGLGTAVFMVYLMRCCRPHHRAAHMAILTALMSVSFTLAGVVSGTLAEQLGFAPYFLLTFFATIPGMLLIPFLPHLRETNSEVPKPSPP